MAKASGGAGRGSGRSVSGTRGGVSGYPRLSQGLTYGRDKVAGVSAFQKGDILTYPGDSGRGRFGGEVSKIKRKTIDVSFVNMIGNVSTISVNADGLDGGFIQRGNKVYKLTS